MKCGMKLRIHSQSSTVASSKFLGKGDPKNTHKVTSKSFSRTLLGCSDTLITILLRFCPFYFVAVGLMWCHFGFSWHFGDRPDIIQGKIGNIWECSCLPFEYSFGCLFFVCVEGGSWGDRYQQKFHEIFGDDLGRTPSGYRFLLRFGLACLSVSNITWNPKNEFSWGPAMIALKNLFVSGLERPVLDYNISHSPN